MEKGVTGSETAAGTDEELVRAVRESFGLKGTDPGQLSPLTLAYVGDAAYELVIRTMLAEEFYAKAGELHKKASTLVNAGAQSEMIGNLKEHLTQEELHIYKRGRNAHPATIAKHARMSDYRRATGFEALMGYLFLEGRTQRMLELIRIGLKARE